MLIKSQTICHIPHSGIRIPKYIDDYIGQLYLDEIEKLTDWDTEEIFNFEDVITICPTFSRVFCDVERLYPDESEAMSQKGMGFVYTHTDDGKVFRNISEERKKIIYQDYYLPHHQKMESLIQQIVEETGKCTIIDCHSFSNQPYIRDEDQSLPRPDICIGFNSDNCNFDLVDYLNDEFYKYTLKVGLNTPYQGSYIPEKFIGDDRVSTVMRSEEHTSELQSRQYL